MFLNLILKFEHGTAAADFGVANFVKVELLAGYSVTRSLGEEANANTDRDAVLLNNHSNFNIFTVHNVLTMSPSSNRLRDAT
jgi:hypothetical protein